MEEGTNGLPDVAGLTAFVQATQDKATVAPTTDQQAQQTQQTPQTETGTAQVQTPAKPDEPDLAQFKTPEALLKGYKELQGAFTRTSQEKAALAKQMEQLQAQFQEQMELMRLSQPRPNIQQAPPAKDFEQMFIENPQKAVETLAEHKAAGMLLQSKIQDVLEEESLKSPQEFQERYAYAKAVSQQYPQLVTSSAGVKKLFQLGDKLRAEQQRTQAIRAVSAVFGDDVDMEKVKTLFKRDAASTNNQNLAYMPDTNSSLRTGAESGNPPDFGSAVHQAAQKGDVDSVLENQFRALGLKT